MAKYREANNAPLYRSNSQQPTRELTNPSEPSHLSRALALHQQSAEFRKDFYPLQERVRLLFAKESVGQQHNLWRHMGKTTLIRFGREQFETPTYRGIQYLEILVHFPGREFHPLDLVSTVNRGTLSQPITDAHLTQAEVRISYGGAKLELVNKKALQQYEKAVKDLQQQLEEAQLLGQEDEIERIRTDMDCLTKEINRARRLGGRSRTASDNESRAANSVPREIRRSIKLIRSRCPALADHLTASLGKLIGRQCNYRPSPGTPPWDY